ncbi:MAG: serine hydrolase domain-containing protein [Bacteroidia bacterium]|nr:serine hydrolase domain-containing protein [Bacteroidia bacterium]
MKKFLLLALAAVAIIACTNKEEEFNKDIQQIIEKNKAVGLAVVAVNNGEVVYSNTYGYKNLEEKIPLEQSDIFRIASISKSFTATAIMQLVEQGKLNLDQDVSDLVGFTVRNPKYPEKVITLKMLLSHTSSMNDSNGYFTINAINPDSSATWQTAWNSYEPGTGYEYCNLGFNTLGTILERVSGERFDKYIVKHILEPIGVYGGYEVLSLDSTKFVNIYAWDKETGKFNHSPAAYATREKEIANYVFGHSTPIFSPTGGLKISPIDLAKVMQMHMNLGAIEGGNIISKESAELMQSVVSPKTENEDTYGFAITSSKNLLDGYTMTGHTGGAYGVYTCMFWDQERKFGFIVMTNGCNGRRDNGFMSIHRECVAALHKHFVAQN